MSNKHTRLGRLYILRYYRFSSMCEEAYEVNSYSNSVLWSILNLKQKLLHVYPTPIVAGVMSVFITVMFIF